MNLILHIVRKDLSRFRWPLLLWAISFLSLFSHDVFRQTGSSPPAEIFRWLPLLIVAVLSIAVIGSIVQEDHPTDGNAAWRTRPITSRQLVAAKFVLIGSMFVVLPVLLVGAKNAVLALKYVYHPQEYVLVVLVLASLALAIASVSACAKNAGHSLLMCVAIVLLTGAVAASLESIAPALLRQAATQLHGGGVLLLLSLSVVAGLAGVLSQYLWRRRSVAVPLAFLTSVTAVIGAGWAGYYFY